MNEPVDSQQFEVGSALSGNALRDWPNDDVLAVYEDIGLFAIADAQGPGYGGWHRPVGIPQALDALAEAWRRLSNAASPDERMSEALLAANSLLISPPYFRGPEKQGPVEDGPEHSSCSVTALVIGAEDCTVGQVGACRAYGVTRDGVELLVNEQCIEPSADWDPDNHPWLGVNTRALGTPTDQGAELGQETRTLAKAPNATWLLCSKGVWLTHDEAQLREACRLSDVQAVADALVKGAHRGTRHGSALVVRER